jgi:hypothetical protein
MPVAEGERHPHSADLPSLTHNELGKHLRVSPLSYLGEFDLRRWAWKHPTADSILIDLPAELVSTGGETIIIRDRSSIFRRAIKFEHPLCICKPEIGARSGGKAGEVCQKCSFGPDTSVVVQRSRAGGNTTSLVEARLVCDAKSAPLELVTALLYSTPGWPPYFAVSRRDVSGVLPPNAGRSVVYTKPPTQGPLAGVDFAFGVVCGAPGCNACAWLCGKNAAPQQLEVRFFGEHVHAALPCKADGIIGCAACVEHGMLPVAAPFGRLEGLFGTLTLNRASASMAGLDEGAQDSPTALFAAVLDLVSAAEVLSGNRARTGASTRNIASLLALERTRVALGQGAPPPTSVADGGPQESVGRVLEQLVRAHVAWRAGACSRSIHAGRNASRQPRGAGAEAWPHHEHQHHGRALHHLALLPATHRAGRAAAE